LPVELGETVEELSIQGSAPNVENAAANRAASTQVKASVDSGIGIGGGKQHVMVSIFKKSQSRKKRLNRTEGIIRLLLIILWVAVVIALGFYFGFAYHH